MSANDTPRTDAQYNALMEVSECSAGIVAMTKLANQLERELAAAQAQRDKAISHLVNMLHAADELADCVGITKWDKEIDMARIFLKECGK